MCARTQLNGITYKVGDRIPVKSADKHGTAKWIGFARSETASIWHEFSVPLDIPVDAFAERHSDGRLVWAKPATTQLIAPDAIFPKLVVSGIGNLERGEVRILTRQATLEELEYFGHDRLPVVIDRRF